MTNRRSIIVAAFAVAFIGCLATSIQRSVADEPGPAIEQRYAENYAGSGEGLLAIDSEGTLWIYYRLDGTEAERFRVMAVSFTDRARPAAHIARNLPYQGKIIVSADPETETLRILGSPSSRIAFGAHLASNRAPRRAPRVWKRFDLAYFPVTSFASATVNEATIDDMLTQVSDLDYRTVGEAWPLILYANGALRGGLGATHGSTRDKTKCCGQDTVCQSGGPGASNCEIGELSVECDAGFFACCCDLGGSGQVDLGVNCCPE